MVPTPERAVLLEEILLQRLRPGDDLGHVLGERGERVVAARTTVCSAPR
jgi:hypothetical protein